MNKITSTIAPVLATIAFLFIFPTIASASSSWTQLDDHTFQLSGIPDEYACANLDGGNGVIVADPLVGWLGYSGVCTQDSQGVETVSIPVWNAAGQPQDGTSIEIVLNNPQLSNFIVGSYLNTYTYSASGPFPYTPTHLPPPNILQLDDHTFQLSGIPDEYACANLDGGNGVIVADAAGVVGWLGYSGVCTQDSQGVETVSIPVWNAAGQPQDGTDIIIVLNNPHLSNFIVGGSWSAFPYSTGGLSVSPLTNQNVNEGGTAYSQSGSFIDTTSSTSWTATVDYGEALYRTKSQLIYMTS